MKDNMNKKIINDINPQNISSGLIAGTLGVFGPAIVVVEAASAGGFSYAETITWIYAVQIFGALLGMMMSLYFRMPIVGAHTITGAAFLVTVTPYFTYQELIGGFMITGLIVFLFGLSGVFTKVMNWIPKEIISAMLAGIITTYVVSLIPAVEELPLIGIPALIVFFILSKWDLKIPPMLGAVMTCILIFILAGDWKTLSLGTDVVRPVITEPSFSLVGAISISVPLALMVLSNDVTPGIGSLQRAGYKTPVNRILTLSGLTSIVSSFFGGHSSNIAGMMTTIAADDDAGEKDKRYIASIVSSIVMIVFGLFAWAFVPLMLNLPESLTAMLIAFVLIGVFASTLKTSFSNPKYVLSATFTFVISISGISIMYISAPVWALLAGTIMAKTIKK